MASQKDNKKTKPAVKNGVPVKKIKTRTRKTGNTKSFLKAATILTIIVMIAAICYGFVKLETFIRHDLNHENESSVELRLVDKPDWLNQELLKRINDTARMGGDRLPITPDTASVVARYLDDHLKWLSDISVRTTADAIEVSAKYRKPIAMLNTDGGMYYVDESLIALDYIPINTFKILEITGFKNKQKPVPGQHWREDDIAAGVKLIRMLQQMDRMQTRKLIYEIESIDVSNYSKRGSTVSQLIIKTIDGPEVLWGAEPGQAVANIEPPEEEKLMSLYQMFRAKGTLKGEYKYIDLRYPQQ